MEQVIFSWDFLVKAVCAGEVHTHIHHQSSWFSMWVLMNHQQHHLGTFQECKFSDPFPDLLNQKLCGPGLAICFKKPSWWFWCSLKFENQSLSPYFVDINQALNLLLWLVPEYLWYANGKKELGDSNPGKDCYLNSSSLILSLKNSDVMSNIW